MRRPKAEISAFIDCLTGLDEADSGNILTIRQLRSELEKKQANLKHILTECQNAQAAAGSTGYQVQYVSQTVTCRVECDAKGLVEHIQRFS